MTWKNLIRLDVGALEGDTEGLFANAADSVIQCRLESLHRGDTGEWNDEEEDVEIVRGRRLDATAESPLDRLGWSDLGYPAIRLSVPLSVPFHLPRFHVRSFVDHTPAAIASSLSFALVDARRPPPIQIRSNFKRGSNQRRTDFTGRNFGWRRTKPFFTFLRFAVRWIRARVKSDILFRFLAPVSRTLLYYERSCKFVLLWQGPRTSMSFFFTRIRYLVSIINAATTVLLRMAEL